MAWDTWLGPAPMRPYNPAYAPFNWRGWWDFGAGALGDMGCHIMDPANWALNLNGAESFSCEVVQQDGKNDQTFPNSSIVKFTFPARGDMAPVDVYWYDGGLQPERPEGIPAEEKIDERTFKNRLGDGNNGSLFIGETGVLTSGEYGGESRIVPDEKMADYTRPAETIERVPREDPYAEWITAMTEGGEAGSNFEYAGTFVETVNMAMVALWTGEKVDYTRGKGITNKPELNQYLSKEYRSGWEVPVESV